MSFPVSWTKANLEVDPSASVERLLTYLSGGGEADDFCGLLADAWVVSGYASGQACRLQLTTAPAPAVAAATDNAGKAELLNKLKAHAASKGAADPVGFDWMSIIMMIIQLVEQLFPKAAAQGSSATRSPVQGATSSRKPKK